MGASQPTHLAYPNQPCSIKERGLTGNYVLIAWKFFLCPVLANNMYLGQYVSYYQGTENIHSFPLMSGHQPTHSFLLPPAYHQTPLLRVHEMIITKWCLGLGPEAAPLMPDSKVKCNCSECFYYDSLSWFGIEELESSPGPHP